MSDPIKARDQAAALALIDAMIGWTGVGVDSNGDEISRPTSPEVRAHLAAVLGDACMSYGNDAKPGRREAMAAYLRSVADHLDPAGAAQSGPDDIRERVKADVAQAIEDGAGIPAALTAAVQKIATERGVLVSEVLLDMLAQMKAVHHG